MPEYLSPGVYVEEVSFRGKSIEGVSTSVAAFIGPTRYGPTAGEPELLTSYADFERIYGGIDSLLFSDASDEQINYMAHAVRAFFDNGGSMLYVTRVYEAGDPATSQDDPNSGEASIVVGSPPGVTLRARFPGRAGQMQITFAGRLTANLLLGQGTVGQTVSGVKANDVVYIKQRPGKTPSAGGPSEGVYDVVQQGDSLGFTNLN